MFPSIALEIAPMKEKEYFKLVDSGCEGLVVYQETYNKTVYKELHTSGPKKISTGDLIALKGHTMRDSEE